MQETMPSTSSATPGKPSLGVHTQLGHLTRQLHNSLNELGYTEQLRASMNALPDAQSRLNYIARLTGDAAEKVLALVDDAKERQSVIVEQTQRMRQAMIKDPVSAVAKGHIMNYLENMERATAAVDIQLTEIMMAQDFHDLTGQVIAMVVHLAANLEQQLLSLLLQTAPPDALAQVSAAQQQQVQPPVAAVAPATATERTSDPNALEADAESRRNHPELHGPVIDPDNTPDIVTSQSEVDDLLASLGF